MASSYDTPSVLLLDWSLLFLTLRWNFLEFGLRAGLDAGWLICAATFFAMAIGGFYTLVQLVRANREFDREKAAKAGLPRPSFISAYAIGNGVAIPVGVVQGVLAFSALAG